MDLWVGWSIDGADNDLLFIKRHSSKEQHWYYIIWKGICRMSNNGGLWKMWNKEGINQRWMNWLNIQSTLSGWMSKKSKSDAKCNQESWNGNFFQTCSLNKLITTCCGKEPNPLPNEAGRATCGCFQSRFISCLRASCARGIAVLPQPVELELVRAISVVDEAEVSTGDTSRPAGANTRPPSSCHSFPTALASTSWRKNRNNCSLN